MKKKKKMSVGGIVLLIFGILILLVVAAALSVFLHFKIGMARAELTIDDIDAYLAMEPDPELDRLAFTQDGTMSLTLDKSDLWIFLDGYLKDNYSRTWQADLKANAAGYQLDRVGLGLVSDNGRLRLDAEAYWKKIRLAASIYFTVECTEGKLVAVPDTIVVAGHEIAVASIVQRFNSSVDELSSAYLPKYYFLTRAEAFTPGENNTFSLSGPMSTAALKEINFSYERAIRMCLYQERATLAGPVFLAYSLDPDTAFDALLPELIKDPDYYKAYLEALFPYMPVSRFAAFATDNYGLALRWDPELTGDYSALNSSLNDEYRIGFLYSQKVALAVKEAYDAGKLKIKDNQFYYNKDVFDVETFFGEDVTFIRNFIDLDTLVLGFVDEESVADPDAPALSKVLDKNSTLNGEYDPDKAYTIAVLVTGADGRDYLLATYGNDDTVATWVALADDYAFLIPG